MKLVGPFDTGTGLPTYGASAFGNWANANPAVGQAGSIPPHQAWSHAVQELVHLIEQAGLTPNEADLTQVYTAVATLVNANRVSVGHVAFFAANAAPANYLKANGALISRTTYAGLWAYAQASSNIAASDGAWQKGQFSPGDGSTTFRIPDLRGEFLRGWDDSLGQDPGRVLGTQQSDELKSHTHSIGIDLTLGSANSVKSSDGVNFGGAEVTTATGGAETRPRNIALLGCIRFQ